MPANKEFYDIGMGIPDDADIMAKMRPEQKQRLLAKAEVPEMPKAALKDVPSIERIYQYQNEEYENNNTNFIPPQIQTVDANPQSQFQVNAPRRFTISNLNITGVVFPSGVVVVEKDSSFQSVFQDLAIFLNSANLGHDVIYWVD